MTEKDTIVGTAHLEHGNFDRSWRDEKWGDAGLAATAQDMTNDEKAMSIKEAIVVYRKAIMWCLVIVSLYSRHLCASRSTNMSF